MLHWAGNSWLMIFLPPVDLNIPLVKLSEWEVPKEIVTFLDVMSKSRFFLPFFLMHVCIYICMEGFLHAHTPATLHSAVTPVSLQGGSASGWGRSAAILEPTDPGQPAKRKGRSSPQSPASPGCTPTPHRPDHHSCSSCFSIKIALPITSHRDQSFPFTPGCLSRSGNADWGAELHNRSITGQETNYSRTCPRLHQSP